MVILEIDSDNAANSLDKFGGRRPVMAQDLQAAVLWILREERGHVEGFPTAVSK